MVPTVIIIITAADAAVMLAMSRRATQRSHMPAEDTRVATEVADMAEEVMEAADTAAGIANAALLPRAGRGTLAGS